MGNSNSQPWRKLEKNGAWTEQYQDKLLNDIASLEKEDDVKKKKVLLWGPVQAGKSTLMNSFLSVNKKRIASVVVTGGGLAADHTVSKKLNVVHFSDKMKSLQLLDIMGIEQGEGEGLNPNDLTLLIEGKFKHHYRFKNTGHSEDEMTESLQAKQSLDEMVHCIVFVVPADVIHTGSLSDDMKNKLVEAIKITNDSGVTSILVLTKIDLVSKTVANDVKSVYHNRTIKEIVELAYEMFGIDKINIFPVLNYRKEVELNTEMNILLLLALRQAARFATDYIENCNRNNILGKI